MWPLFAAADADSRPTFRWPANVRRSVRAVRMEAGLGWMTPHTWQRTYAMILHDEIGLSDRQKADLMSHAKISMMKDTYVNPRELHQMRKKTQVNMATEWRLRSVFDSCLTRTDRHLIASGAGYARPRDG